MKVRYLAVAQIEIREAAEYYSAVSPSLGIAFKQELRRLIQLVATMPEA